MAATGVGLLTTIIATPVAIATGAIASGLLGAGGRFVCRKLEAKARKHDQIRVLAVSKLNSIADRISAALTDDKVSEEFHLILSEVDKYDQMKAEIRRGRQKEGALPETEKNRLMNPMRDEMMLTARGISWKSSELLETVAPLGKYILFAGLKKESALWAGSVPTPPLITSSLTTMVPPPPCSPSFTHTDISLLV